MKKGSLIAVTVFVAVFMFASSSVAAAQSGEPGTIECVLDITYDDHGDGTYWLGTVTGPGCTVEGTIKFFAVSEEYFNAGKTVHFVEAFTIEPDSGGFISGKNWGLWNLPTLKYRATGWVREASPQWAHLVGSQYHEMGRTSDPAVMPITAPDGWARIAPAKRPSQALPQ